MGNRPHGSPCRRGVPVGMDTCNRKRACSDRAQRAAGSGGPLGACRPILISSRSVSLRLPSSKRGGGAALAEAAESAAERMADAVLQHPRRRMACRALRRANPDTVPTRSSRRECEWQGSETRRSGCAALISICRHLIRSGRRSSPESTEGTLGAGVTPRATIRS